MFKLLAVVAVFFAFIPAADVQLKYQFKVGDEYVWTQTTQQSIKQNVMGSEQKSETKNSGEFVTKVVEVTVKGAKLEGVFTKLKTEANSPMGSTRMDSEGDQSSDENKLFKSMMNKPFHIYITNLGEIEKVEGVDNLWSGIRSLGLDEQKVKMLEESLKTMLGPAAIKASMQSAFIKYPDKKVKTGDKWTVSSEVSVGFSMAVSNTWNVESISGNEAKLVADGTMTTTNKDDILNLPAGLKAKTNLKGQQAMKSTVDSKTGWPTKHEMLGEVKGTMTLLKGAMIPDDMEIPMEILTETSYVIKKK